MIIDNFSHFATDEVAFGDDSSVIVGDEIDTKDSRNLGHGTPVSLILQVSTPFTGGTSAEFKLMSDAVNPILPASATLHLTTGAIPVADLVVGWRKVLTLPNDIPYERYLGIVSTYVGTGTAGKIDAWLSLDRPGWYPGEEAISRHG